MNAWDLTSGVGRLQRAAHKLHDQWELAQEHWHDSASRDFSAEHLDPLLPKLKSTLAAIARLNDVLEDGKRALIDDDEPS